MAISSNIQGVYRGGVTDLFSKTKKKSPNRSLGFLLNSGAGNEARTRDLNLGKVALYQLSYSRIFS